MRDAGDAGDAGDASYFSFKKAWSPTARNARRREGDKGENKEYMFRYAQLQVCIANIAAMQ